MSKKQKVKRRRMNQQAETQQLEQNSDQQF